MYADYNLHALQYREIREQELAERMAESTRRALDASLRPSLRARMARRLFALAVATDRKETWNVVGRRWKRKDAYKTKLVGRSGRTRKEAPYPP